MTPHSNVTREISKEQFSDLLTGIKIESVTDGAFIYLHSPTIGLLKFKVLEESIDILIHKP